ncbi:MAG TPA: ABC transporter ATP-binding protein [Deltaproteobacteria bacterium]|nr:ABC transporter ATP-binding protein [Deltaproteobacteria bacterium]
MIIVKDVKRVYQTGETEVHALRGVSLNIEQGEFMSIAGPSGSGKTTLLNLIAGIDKPDRGNIVIDGIDITRLDESRLSRWRARHVGFIFQFYNLIPVLTAYENVELPLLLAPLTRKQRKKHVLAALKVTGILDRATHFPSQLSGGQQQRVAIARAIVTDPTIIVADEPTGDLDKDSAAQILDLLNHLNKELGKTIVMVTHDYRAARRARKIYVLDKGVLRDQHENDMLWS